MEECKEAECKMAECNKPLDYSERGEWKVGLKFNIQKTKIMAPSPITLWQIQGKTWKQWQNLFSWTPKSLWAVTIAIKLGDFCLGRRVITNLDSVLKGRGITLPTKVHVF